MTSITTSTVIFRRQSLSLSLLTPCTEFFCFADAPIGPPLLKKPHRMSAIEVYTLGLAIRPLIPIESQPFHPLDNSFNGFISRPALIRVFDPEYKYPLLLASKQPIKQGGADPSDMEKTGRAGRESDPDLAHSIALHR